MINTLTREQSSQAQRRIALALSSLFLLFALPVLRAQVCPCPAPPGIDIISRSAVDGSINNMPLQATVLATFNTTAGGQSTCEFSSLPTGFTPGTLSVFE
jgi:hypothetical protein